MYNGLAGFELAKIIGQKLTEELREYSDFGAAVCYDNPSFVISVTMEAMEIEPLTVEVKGSVATGALPAGIKTKPRLSKVEVIVPAMKQPDKERIEAGLVVPDQVRNETTGEVADFSPDKMPF